jgi:Flp pilus assembly protein TadD
LAEPSGQLLLVFGPPEDRVNKSIERRHLPEELSDRAHELELAGRPREAADLYRRLVEECPTDAQLWLNYGNTLYALGQTNLAADAFRTSATCDPHFADAWNNLGAALADMEHWDDALVAFEQALVLRPEYADARENLAALRDELPEQNRHTPQKTDRQ